MSPSEGGSGQAQTFHLILDDRVQRPDTVNIQNAQFEITIEFCDGESGSAIPTREFAYPHRESSSNVQLSFRLTPLNPSTGADSNIYTSEWQFTVPASVMATWKAKSNTATIQFSIRSTIGITFVTDNFDVVPQYDHPFTFRDDATDSATTQAITAQTRLASQLSTQTIRTTSNRLHSLRRERHAQRRAGNRNQLDTQNRFTQGLKVHFANPDIDHLVRRAVIANQMSASSTGDNLAPFP